MKWEEFIDIPVDENLTGQVQTDIKCPECGRNIYLDTKITLTSYPEKYAYWCSCGWYGYAPTKWRGES